MGFFSFLSFSEQYGSVFSVRVGSDDMVMITGYDEIKEVMQTHAAEYINRPEDDFNKKLNQGHGKYIKQGLKDYLIFYLSSNTIKETHCRNFRQNYCTHSLDTFTVSFLYSQMLHLPFWQPSHACKCHYSPKRHSPLRPSPLNLG